MQTKIAWRTKPGPGNATGGFPAKLSRGSSTLKLYRHRDRKGYEVFTLSYYLKGRRQRPTFASLPEAKAEADRVLDLLNQGESEVLTLSSTDRLIYVRSRALLDQTEIPLGVAIGEFVHARSMLKQQGTLTEAVSYFIRNHSTAIKPQSVEEAVAELIKTRKADGSGPRHVDDLESRMTRFVLITKATDERGQLNQRSNPMQTNSA